VQIFLDNNGNFMATSRSTAKATMILEGIILFIQIMIEKSFKSHQELIE
jgi:hypothetical protein